jgi:hypothetical protein
VSLTVPSSAGAPDRRSLLPTTHPLHIKQTKRSIHNDQKHRQMRQARPELITTPPTTPTPTPTPPTTPTPTPRPARRCRSRSAFCLLAVALLLVGLGTGGAQAVRVIGRARTAVHLRRNTSPRAAHALTHQSPKRRNHPQSADSAPAQPPDGALEGDGSVLEVAESQSRHAVKLGEGLGSDCQPGDAVPAVCDSPDDPPNDHPLPPSNPKTKATPSSWSSSARPSSRRTDPCVASPTGRSSRRPSATPRGGASPRATRSGWAR